MSGADNLHTGRNERAIRIAIVAEHIHSNGGMVRTTSYTVTHCHGRLGAITHRDRRLVGDVAIVVLHGVLDWRRTSCVAGLGREGNRSGCRVDAPCTLTGYHQRITWVGRTDYLDRRRVECAIQVAVIS